MKYKFWRRTLFILVLLALLFSGAAYLRWTAQLPRIFVVPLLTRIKMPPGFAIHVYATGVPNARSMALGTNGTVFVGSRRVGKVYALVNHGQSDQADEVITIAGGLNSPNGVAFRDGSLYVAAVDRVLRYDNIEGRLKNPPVPVVVSDNFPGDADHGWRATHFGPDGLFYVSSGMPCNICNPTDERFGTIRRMRPDGSGLEIYARGLRNSVGFDWNPKSGELWFTDNGREELGDDSPPDELNYAPRPEMHFGFPFCDGKNISDPQFGNLHSCSEFTPPAAELPAHVAALGMRFYTGNMFPEAFRNRIFIAEHGSSNRTTPIGYRITLVSLDGNQPVKYEIFASGWQIGNFKWGRPVDVQVMPDGAMLVSDDYAGAIYRITYTK